MEWLTLLLWGFMAFMILKVLGIDAILLSVIDRLLSRPKALKDNDPDILRRVKALRLRAGRINSPRYKWLELRGDKWTGNIRMGRIVGIIESHYVYEIFFRPHWFSRAIWFPVLRDFVESSHGRALVVRCNGIQPFGLGIFHLPVFGEEDAHQREPVYVATQAYIHNILKREQVVLTEERSVHNALCAPGSDKISVAMMLQEDNNGEVAPE